MKWIDVKYPKCEVVLSAADENKDTLPCARHLPMSKMLKWLIASMELKRYTYKTCYDVKMGLYNIQKYKKQTGEAQ